MKAVHIATLHKRHDTRILLKECVSLSQAGVDTTLIVGDGEGDEDFEGVKIVDVGRPSGRFASRLVPMWRAARRVRSLAPDVAHFHDGMFLPLGIGLALRGWRVIYDVHEDHPREVMELRFPVIFRYTASVAYTVLEWIGARLFTRIVPVTAHIASRFPRDKTVIVQNFPLSGELSVAGKQPQLERKPQFAYVGGITPNRGAREMIDAMPLVDRPNVTLVMAGAFNPTGLEGEVQKREGWRRVAYRKWLSRADVAALLGDSRAGLVLFHPMPNNMAGQPNKLFEYMSAGLPVIASDFPLWRQIVGGAKSGLLVNPLVPAEIAKAMQWILDHPDEAEHMGRLARASVLETYNWDRESQKLLEMYRSLSRHPASIIALPRASRADP